MATEKAIKIGRALARELFAARGNHSEVHLSEAELVAALALAAERAEAPKISAEFFDEILGQGRR